MIEQEWQTVCELTDIAPNTGVCALHLGQQVAVFRVGPEDRLFAIQNYCPFGEANVLSRGIVGDVNGRLVLASPLYKQQFCLESGLCLEDEAVALTTFGVRLDKQLVQLSC